jgi:catechol 2,3-dioxygenase-like lactoylglutathione lyase family enzyme
MLHHIALGARDVAALATFYTHFFELVELARHLDGEGALRSIWLELGPGAALMIERTDAAARQVDGIGAGPFLLAFGVADQGERAERCEALERAGHAVEAETGYTSYTRDPEGNRVALSCYPLPMERR